MSVYYRDDWCTLHMGDAREVTDWLEGDLLVWDPPYGIGWRSTLRPDGTRLQIVADEDTVARDTLLGMWGGERPAAIFGDLRLPPPEGVRQVMVYRKPRDSGRLGSVGGWRRDLEAVYLRGGAWGATWPDPVAETSSVLDTGIGWQSGQGGGGGGCGGAPAREAA